MNTRDTDPLVDRFRLRVRLDRERRDEDQRAVEQQRLRVRVGRDFVMGNSDVYPSEPAAEEAAVVIVRLMNIGGRFVLVWFVPADCIDGFEGLPVSIRRGAYRRSIYPNRNPAGSAVRAAAWSTERRAA